MSTVRLPIVMPNSTVPAASPVSPGSSASTQNDAACSTPMAAENPTTGSRFSANAPISRPTTVAEAMIATAMPALPTPIAEPIATICTWVPT